MFESLVETVTKRPALTGRVLSILLLRIIMYCVTYGPSISWLQRSALNFKFSVFTFPKSTSCWIIIEQKLCKEKYLTPIFVKFYDIYWAKVGSPEFWYILPGLNIQLEQSENDNPVCNEISRYDISNTSFFSRSMQTHSLVVKASCSESVYMGWIPAGWWNLCHPSAIFRGTEAVSAPTRGLLYCCALNIIISSRISSVVISRWESFKS